MITIDRARSALRFFGLASLSACAAPAFAHHAMGGAPPATAFERLLSGIAHSPVGMNHLALTVAAGLLAAGIVARRKGIAKRWKAARRPSVAPLSSLLSSRSDLKEQQT